MVAETWIIKMGNQVSANLKQALLLDSPIKKTHKPNSSLPKQTIGILSFEVANIMSKTVHLHRSLSDNEISKLKSEVFRSEGVKNLVSSDETHLLNLVVSEKLDDLSRVASVVSRLGKKCNEPALQGFEHVYEDIVNGVIDFKKLGFLVKDMEGMVKKMERFVNATCSLYCEMEVMNELEQAIMKLQRSQQHQESVKAFEQKLMWQRQDVRSLRDASLWSQTYDKVVEMLARTVCTIYGRIETVFGGLGLRGGKKDVTLKRDRSKNEASKVMNSRSVTGFKDTRRNEVEEFTRTGDFNFPCGTNPGRLFMECLAMNRTIDDDDDEDGIARVSIPLSGARMVRTSKFGFKSKLTQHASASTIGGSALSLHYANVVIVVEKLLKYPHLIGEEARDDLYQMLPTSLKTTLKANLRSYLKNISIYDAPLAHDWKETIDGILSWLAPLAHNMIRWQSERNFEQHNQIVKRTNVLLLQTLYFADREKTEAAICKLLVGLNYICHYEQQQNALLDCASSFDYEDCFEWQTQCRAAYLD
ncbi:Protein PSK SIMULATOR 1 [Cardamine amara subsp. amara]|uniref:Protein PSK SIMULATOR 1 n=1 Tax=Cardamine amara subsp. amara TaxID=228776 RepID=A0ABD0ZUN6_CARAN